ncbi:hypothetical protein HC891_08485 [Candidatus Gracilibacteria bacterium]|nr:hypothetical protein [Candidatus Gracilibacteria bacterium]
MVAASNRWQLIWREHVLFYGYRWLTWAFAGMALTLPGRPASALPRDAALLLLTGVLNVGLTALASAYVRVSRRRPFLLGLDIVASVMILWASGSTTLPFLPYALSSLILPALLFGWRGVFFFSTAFVLLEIIGLRLINAQSIGALTNSEILIRVFAPLAFGMLALCAVPIVRHYARQHTRAHSGNDPGAALSRRSNVAELSSGFVRLAENSPALDATKNLLPFENAAAMPITTIRTTERSVDAPRQLIYDLTPGLDVDLPVALGQLANNFGRHCAIDTQLNLIGTAQQLHLSQHGVLLRLAQEALLNVQQHARAKHVQLTLHYETRHVVLTIQDNGVGLLDGTHERPGLHALRAMRYRLVELDGQLDVFECDSGGVVVRARLPRDA